MSYKDKENPFSDKWGRSNIDAWEGNMTDYKIYPCIREA